MRGIFRYQLPGQTGTDCTLPVIQQTAVEKAAHDLPANDYSRFWKRTTGQVLPLVLPLLHGARGVADGVASANGESSS